MCARGAFRLSSDVLSPAHTVSSSFRESHPDAPPSLYPFLNLISKVFEHRQGFDSFSGFHSTHRARAGPRGGGRLARLLVLRPPVGLTRDRVTAVPGSRLPANPGHRVCRSLRGGGQRRTHRHTSRIPGAGPPWQAALAPPPRPRPRPTSLEILRRARRRAATHKTCVSTLSMSLVFCDLHLEPARRAPLLSAHNHRVTGPALPTERFPAR